MRKTRDMFCSASCARMIAGFESFQSKPYICPGGIATIGYGTTVYPDGTKVELQDHPIDEPLAIHMLHDDLLNRSKAINAMLQVQLSQNQFDALCSFAHNLGVNTLRKSTLLMLVNLELFSKASEEFGRYVYTGKPKKVSNGLKRRRQAEATLFMS